MLFDQGTPVPLRESFIGHEVSTAYERGWATLKNGDLLDVVERAGFDVLVTTDKNLKHQQDLRGRSIAIVVLTTTSWPRIRRQVSAVARAVEDAESYVEVRFPAFDWRLQTAPSKCQRPCCGGRPPVNRFLSPSAINSPAGWVV